MSISMVETIAMAIACAIVAAVLMWNYREYLRAFSARRPGESLWQAFQRGSTEHELNQHAMQTMLGGRVFTLLASVAAVTLTMFTLIWMLQGRWLGYIACLYLAIGIVMSSRLNLRRHRQWARLGPIARQELRLAHAWLWPVHVANLRLGRLEQAASASASKGTGDDTARG